MIPPSLLVCEFSELALAEKLAPGKTAFGAVVAELEIVEAVENYFAELEIEALVTEVVHVRWFQSWLLWKLEIVESHLSALLVNELGIAEAQVAHWKTGSKNAD